MWIQIQWHPSAKSTTASCWQDARMQLQEPTRWCTGPRARKEHRFKLNWVTLVGGRQPALKGGSRCSLQGIQIGAGAHWKAEPRHQVAMATVSAVASQTAIQTMLLCSSLVMSSLITSIGTIKKKKTTPCSWYELPAEMWRKKDTSTCVCTAQRSRGGGGRFVLVLEWKQKCLFQLACNHQLIAH